MADLPVVNAIEELKESNKDQRQRLQKSLRAGLLNVVKSVESLTSVVSQGFQLQNELQKAAMDADARARAREYEAQLEAKRKLKKTDTEKPEPKEKDGLGLLGIAGIIAAVGAGLAAAVAGFGMELAKTINSVFFNRNSKFIAGLTKGYKFLTEGLVKYFDDLRSAINKRFIKARKLADKSVKDFIRPIQRFFARFAQSPVGKILNNLTVKPLTQAFELIQDLIKQVKSFAGMADDAVKGVKTVGGFFTRFIGFFNQFQPIVKIMGTVGRIVGKLFLPFTIFMGAWEALSGFITGFTETQGDIGDKIIAGLSDAVENLVNFFIAEPLNLIKDVVAWIAGKLGFENASEAIGSFDFMTQIFNPIIDTFTGLLISVKDFFKGLFTWDVSLMGDSAETITDFILDLVGAPFNLLMDALGWISKQFGFENLEKMFEELDFGTIVKDILMMPYNALKSVGSMIGDLFGFGDDEEEEEKKALSSRRQEAELRKQKLRDRLKKDQESMRSLDEIDADLYQNRKDMAIAVRFRDSEGKEAARLRANQLLEERRAVRGAEIDARSKDVASAPPVVNVTAPQSSTVNNNSNKTNNTTVAPASPRRGRNPVPQGYTDPVMGA